ncbi:3-dehydroquinate synthase [Paenibacillus sp. P96]|uniref:3-dehydroquinate synthase n=1 Tax=Paenibacillus zeirhizosphaerae TaxID=2987519 RepID=A0ABT9FPI8_9BACL|nr:3-dehydroquinate synthase [Paenibacillus sp. P96]MDP4096644.1 3-dehydroquinate synthase [Paenibacillus sp. P96]
MGTLIVELGDRSYPIHIGQGLLEQAGVYFARHGMSRKSPHLIISDGNTAPLYLNRLTDSLAHSGYKVLSFIVQPGEKSKSLSVYEEVITAAIEGGLDRSSSIVALGGGVVGDLAGFAAASYMRGIRFIQIPTTILAHDSSVGGKVGINHPLAKNMIGAFHQPELVLYDVNTLLTLPPREVSAGLAEMLKHGLIWDADFARWCQEHADSLLALEPEVLEYGLEKGCAIKAKVVSQDERENGLRAILNLGHTIGHAIEAIAGYGTFLHGEAISIGMVGSAMLGVRLGADPSLVEETRSLLQSLRLPVALPRELDTDTLMGAMMHDKKFKEGSITFVVPLSIGQVEIRKDIPASLVREVVEQLKEEE